MPDDPRERPYDPAGSRPKHDPASLLPQRSEMQLWSTAAPASITEPFDPFEHRGAPREPEEIAAAAAPRESPFMPRFQFLTGALLAIGIAAVAVLALIAVRGDESREVATVRWSEWTPVQGAGEAPKQIADHVGRKYRLSGQQLVAVEGGPMELKLQQGTSLPITVAQRTVGGDVEIVDGDGVLYRLCGLGPNCSIDRGRSSSERHLLLRREALELALYSFTYLEDIDHAVVFMPPPPGKTNGNVLLFRKSDLQGALNRPLTATISPRTPSVASVRRSPDTPFVDQVTLPGRGTFDYQYTQVNGDLRAYLVLEPPAPPTATAPGSSAAPSSGSTSGRGSSRPGSRKAGP